MIDSKSNGSWSREEPLSLVRSEIAEQPEVLERLLAEEGGAIAAAAREIARRRPRYAVIAARGSSDNAARYAQHLLGRLARMPVALATPSLHTLYHEPPRYTDALVLGISQSGESPDIVAVLEEARRQGCATLAITNDPDSPLARAAGHSLALHAGEERSVAATKTYTASLGLLAALVSAICGDRARRTELQAMPEAMARQLALAGEVDDLVPVAAGWERLAVIGRGADYGTAFEAALKLKELTRHRRRAVLPGRLPARPDRGRRPRLPGARDRAAGPDRRGRARGARRRCASAAARRSSSARPARTCCGCG